MDTLILRFDAPLISFGAPIVDNRGEVQPYPALSMLCGLLGNALGYDHRDTQKLQRLQKRLRYASRRDEPGTRLRDYQTVDLGQPFMRDEMGWTTRGSLEQRQGGKASTGTHQRFRQYWADSVHTVALALEPPDESPDLEEVAQALQQPERPLFIGRKPCLPAAPLLVGRLEADDLREALCRAPLSEGTDSTRRCMAWWPSRPDEPLAEASRRPVTDGRDWANQIHVGERWVAFGEIEVEPEEVHDE